MSLFQRKQLGCPACGETTGFDVIYSVNADRRPDLRQAILDGTFQRGTCDQCQALFRLAPELSYLDGSLKLWILVQPADWLPQWRDLEVKAQSTFDLVYGPTSPALARELGAQFQVRVTFGWAALREKIALAQAGLADASVELLKLALIRTAADLPLRDDVELRFAYVDGDELWFAWIRVGVDEMVEMVSVPRALLDAIAQDRQEETLVLREQLTAGTFLDVHRLLTGP